MLSNFEVSCERHLRNRNFSSRLHSAVAFASIQSPFHFSHPSSRSWFSRFFLETQIPQTWLDENETRSKNQNIFSKPHSTSSTTRPLLCFLLFRHLYLHFRPAVCFVSVVMEKEREEKGNLISLIPRPYSTAQKWFHVHTATCTLLPKPYAQP